MSSSVTPRTPLSDDAVEWQARVAALEARLEQEARELESWRSQHQLLEQLVEHTDALVFAVDHQWRFTYVSALAARAFGHTPEALLGQILWEVYPQLLGS